MVAVGNNPVNTQQWFLIARKERFRKEYAKFTMLSPESHISLFCRIIVFLMYKPLFKKRMMGFGTYTFKKEPKQKLVSRIIIASMPVYIFGHLGNILQTV